MWDDKADALIGSMRRCERETLVKCALLLIHSELKDPSNQTFQVIVFGAEPPNNS